MITAKCRTEKENKKMKESKEEGRGLSGSLGCSESFVHWLYFPFVAGICSQKYAVHAGLGAQQTEAPGHTCTRGSHAPHGTK